MNKIIKYWPFTPFYPNKWKIATKHGCITFGAATSLRKLEVLKSVLI